MNGVAGEVTALLTEALAALRAGDPAAAEATVRRAHALAPDVAEVHNALGVVARAGGRADEAEAAYRRVLELSPDHPRALANLADLARLRGDDEAALGLAQRAVQADPRTTNGWQIIAQCHFAAGRLDAAADATGAGLRATPGAPGLLLFLGKIEHDRKNYAAACAAYREYLKSDPGNAEILADLGAALLERNRDDEALAAFQAAAAADPDYAPAQFGLRETIDRLVPSWHIPMMNEPQRNHAYRDAIRALVRPGDHVLEVGTGAGLLSLLAAEAGAERVTTCEMVPVVAEAARDVLRASLYSDRIHLVAKKSNDVELGADMDGRADIMVSEILANDFVGEGVLPSLIDARRRLLKPDARIVPATGELRAVLVGGPEIEYLLDLDEVCGFDMRAFARLRPWRQFIPQKIDYAALSDDVTLLEYDFARVETLEPVDKIVPVRATQDGRCYGVLQWIRIGLAPGIAYENHPRDTVSVWNKVLYAFPEPIEVSAGDRVGVRLWQRDDYLFVTLARS